MGLQALLLQPLLLNGYGLRFCSVKALLLVGIGGGVYTIKNDMRLGDVVVSRPDGKYGGVVHYDFGKSLLNGRFEYTGALNSPPREILSTLAAMKANHLLDGSRLPDYLIYLEESQSNLHLKYPGTENDLLFDVDYNHVGGSDCTSCDKAWEIKRKPRKANGPVIHYGTVASANQLMRDSKRRDLYNKEYDGRILCFEMEAAGLMNSTSCLVIRGISDYADSHKRGDHAWHGYAAAAAAAFAKEFINTIPGGGLKGMSIIAEALEKEAGAMEPGNSVDSKTIFMVPYKRNLRFVGRMDIFDELDEKFALTKDTQPKAAIYGLGGIGKSQIALEYAYRLKERSPLCSIFWIHASNSVRFEEAYQQIASECGVPGRDGPKLDLMQLVRNWLERNYKCGWLMIVDNVDDANVFFRAKTGTGMTLLEYIPQSSAGSILYTTRNRDIAIDLTIDPISVPVMSLAEARVLLDEKIRGESTDEAQAELLGELEYLPLAITQAVAFMMKRNQTISQYLDLYRHSDSSRIRLLSHEFIDHGTERRPMESVAASFMISFEYIRTRDPRAADILSLMGFLDRQGIPSSLLGLDNEDQVAFIDAIGVLEAFSLIVMNERGSSYNIHRLVQLATRTWLIEYDNPRRWASQALSILAARFPNAEYEKWRLCATYLPHAEATLHCDFEDCSQTYTLARATLLFKTSRYLNTQGSFEAARTKAKESVELRERLLGPQHPNTMISLGNLAVVLWSEGKYQAAEEMNRRVVEGQENVLGKNHPDTLTSVDNLGLVLRKSGKLEAAEEMIRRALEGREKILGEEHPDTLTSMNHLSEVLERQGKLEAAETMAQQALKGSEKVMGEDHPNTLASVDILVWALRKQDKAEKAEMMARRALKGREKSLGKEHPDTLVSVHSLAMVLGEQRKHKAAEEMHQRALKWREKALGEEHPDTLNSVYGLARTLGEQGKYKAAEELDRRALKGREKALGEEHPATLRSVSSLAWTLGEQGKHEAAEELHRRALKGREKALGEEHPATLRSVSRLAWTLRKQGKHEATEELDRRALKAMST